MFSVKLNWEDTNLWGFWNQALEVYNVQCGADRCYSDTVLSEQTLK